MVGRRRGFPFLFATLEEVGLSPEPFEAGSDIHAIVTFDYETPVWRESSFEVDTLETKNWKQNFVDI